MPGVRGHKAGQPARITPRDLCRVFSSRRQPVAGDGLRADHGSSTHHVGSNVLNRRYGEPTTDASTAGSLTVADDTAIIALIAEKDRLSEEWDAKVVVEGLEAQIAATRSGYAIRADDPCRRHRLAGGSRHLRHRDL